MTITKLICYDSTKVPPIERTFHDNSFQGILNELTNLNYYFQNRVITNGITHRTIIALAPTYISELRHEHTILKREVLETKKQCSTEICIAKAVNEKNSSLFTTSQFVWMCIIITFIVAFIILKLNLI